MRIGFLLIALFCVAASGCTADDPGHPESSNTSKNSDAPILLTWPPGGASMEALVHGTLRVNEAGCFALDDNVLVAPPDSSVLETGDGITVPGLGEITVGDRISSSGGYLEAGDLTSVEGLAACLSESSSKEVAVLSR